MMPEKTTLLLVTGAASVGLLHTLIGPDHYLPFLGLAKARRWSTAKAAAITSACGLGHVASSILLGLLGIWAGVEIERLVGIENLRGQIVSWGLLAFGLVYGTWGLHRAMRGKRHTHLHAHEDGEMHDHGHGHETSHAHPHDQEGPFRTTPWVLFILFVFGPCEPLIPLVMATYATSGRAATALVSLAFSMATLACMLGIVLLGLKGTTYLRLGALEKYSHAMAGGAVAACGLGMVYFGL